MSKEIENSINKVLSLIKDIEIKSAFDLMGYYLILHKYNLLSVSGLSSPQRQYVYLASRRRKNGSKVFNKNLYINLRKPLEEIIKSYTKEYFPTEQELKSKLNLAKYNKGRVALSSFIDYFTTGMVCHSSQKIKRITDWFIKYNDDFKDINGISVKEIISIYDFIKSKLEDKINNCLNYLKENPTYGTIEEIVQDENTIFTISKKDIIDKFGKEISSIFISTFCIESSERDFKYFTQSNPIDDSPLLKINNQIHCGFLTILLDSIYFYLYKEIEKSNRRDNFYLNRHESSVGYVLNLFKKIFKEEGEYFQSVYETDDANNEHDLLVVINKYILIIEVKTFKLKEPRRNPGKAFQIIEQEFKKENGIQGGFNQAYQLKKEIKNNHNLPLFNKKGEKICELEKDCFDKIFLIIVTADQFGLIASNLSLMLQKDESEPYPLCINLFDFETLIEGFIDLNYPSQKFFDYLIFREKYHKIFLTSDELEIAGSFIDGNNYENLSKEENARIVFSPDMSKIFDELYSKRIG